MGLNYMGTVLQALSGSASQQGLQVRDEEEDPSMSLMRRVEAFATEFLGEVIPEKTDSKDKFLQMLEKSRNAVYIVAGELDPSFYCGHVVEAMEQKLGQIASYTVSVIFHKADTKTETIKLLKKDNRQLVSLFCDSQYTNRIRLFWAEKRPRFHFIVADQDTMLEEKDHPPNERRRVYVRRADSRLSSTYRGHFENMRRDRLVHELAPSDFA